MQGSLPFLESRSANKDKCAIKLKENKDQHKKMNKCEVCIQQG